MKISQCMIVRDEEQNIERALSWGRGVVDEQIVVDTGSTDRTVEIAERMGAKIYHFEWINDFSAAKNYAIEQCTGDWIAFLDADEYFSDEDAKCLRTMLSQAVSQCNVIVTPLANLDANGEITEVTAQTRLFKNKPYIRYKNAIHETLFSADEKQKLSFARIENDFTIFHTGYTYETRELREKKANRNLEPMLEELKKDPDNEMNYFYIAPLYFLLRDYKKAVEYADTAIQKVEKKSTAPAYLDNIYIQLFDLVYEWAVVIEFNIDEYEKKETLLKRYGEATELFPQIPDFDYYMGGLFFESGKYEQAIDYLEKAIAKIYKSETVSGKAISSMDILYLMLAESYFRAEDMKKFVNYAVECLKLKKHIAPTITTKLIFVLMDSGETLKSVFEFFSKLYDFENPADFTFVLKAAQDVKPPFFAQYMTENMPEKLRELM